MNTKIKAKATAREFPPDAFPLKYDENYARDEHNHLIITDGKNILQPISKIENVNVFVNTGKYWLGDTMIGVKTTTLTHVGVGTSTSTPLATDTTLLSALSSRHIWTDRFRGTNVVTLSTFFSSVENNGSWNEAAIFTAASGGDMFCRSTFDATVTKASTNTQTIDFDITIN